MDKLLCIRLSVLLEELDTLVIIAESSVRGSRNAGKRSLVGAGLGGLTAGLGMW